MENIILVVHLILAICLIGVVLLDEVLGLLPELEPHVPLLNVGVRLTVFGYVLHEGEVVVVGGDCTGKCCGNECFHNNYII